MVVPKDGEPQSVEELISLRSRKILLVSKRNMLIASLDRCFHQYIKQFYSLVAEFTRSMVDRRHICVLAEELSDLRIEGGLSQPEMMSHVDQVLGGQAVKLLCAGRSTVEEWLVLLPQLVERVKHSVTVRWSKDCFTPMAEQLVRGDQDGDQAAGQMEKIFRRFQKGIAELLDPHGRGVVEYVRKVTGAELPHVGLG